MACALMLSKALVWTPPKSSERHAEQLGGIMGYYQQISTSDTPNIHGSSISALIRIEYGRGFPCPSSVWPPNPQSRWYQQPVSSVWSGIVPCFLLYPDRDSTQCPRPDEGGDQTSGQLMVAHLMNAKSPLRKSGALDSAIRVIPS